MPVREVNDSSLVDVSPLISRWETVLGGTAKALIDFLQVINDELDTQMTAESVIVN